MAEREGSAACAGAAHSRFAHPFSASLRRTSFSSLLCSRSASAFRFAELPPLAAQVAEREGFEPGVHLEAKSRENADLVNG